MKQSEQRIDFAAGVRLFEEGDSADDAFIIEQGKVEISFDRGEERIVLAALGPGELLGEMALVNGEPRSATATALVDTRVSRISRNEIQAKLAAADPVVNLFMRVLLERVKDFAKRGYGSCLAFENSPVSSYSDDLVLTVDSIRARDEIREALELGQFRLFYQPITDIASGKPCGFEALIRWQHPERGLLGPYAFIDFAEKENLIVPIGSWVLEEACRAAVRFKKVFADQPFFVSINVAPSQFLQPDFQETFQAALQSSGADPAWVKLEVTENLLFEDPDSALATLQNVRSLGASLALDDFGTGYCSMSYLHKFPFDTLKIDRSFIITMREKSSSLEIVRCVVAMAKALSMKIVAEGIETVEDADLLADLECDYGQGYLYAKPLPEDEATHLVSQR